MLIDTKTYNDQVIATSRMTCVTCAHLDNPPTSLPCRNCGPYAKVNQFPGDNLIYQHWTPKKEGKDGKIM